MPAKARGMCKESPLACVGGASGAQTACSVRHLARALAAVECAVPGTVLEFGQRKAGQIVLRHGGVDEVIMWPVTRNAWPFIADTKPTAVGCEEGMNRRWGLDASEVVRCEVLPGETRAHVLSVRTALQAHLVALGVPCVARRGALRASAGSDE